MDGIVAHPPMTNGPNRQVHAPGISRNQNAGIEKSKEGQGCGALSGGTRNWLAWGIWGGEVAGAPLSRVAGWNFPL